MSGLYRLRPGRELLLASASPRRREMLARLGLVFRVVPTEVDETILPGEAAEEAAFRLARRKAEAALAGAGGAAVLAADTLVALDDAILGKPADREEARAMLATLSGREHRVVTGYCLALDGERLGGRVVSRVRFRELGPAEIAAYLLSGEPCGKAGAYAVQGLGAALVAEVRGSYTNVVGLPLSEVVELLLARGVIAPAPEGEVAA